MTNEMNTLQEKLKHEERENKMEKQKYTRLTEKEAIELGYKGKFNSDRFVYYKVFRNNGWVVGAKKGSRKTITQKWLNSWIKEKS